MRAIDRLRGGEGGLSFRSIAKMTQKVIYRIWKSPTNSLLHIVVWLSINVIKSKKFPTISPQNQTISCENISSSHTPYQFILVNTKKCGWKQSPPDSIIGVSILSNIVCHTKQLSLTVYHFLVDIIENSIPILVIMWNFFSLYGWLKSTMMGMSFTYTCSE